MPKATLQAQHSTPIVKTSLLQRTLEPIWYQGAWGKQLLYPLEAIYRVLATIDRRFKERQSVEHAVPIIIVGNISVGGTGKTPLVIYLCDLLIKEGYSPGIITRGYGGKSTQWPVSVNACSNPAECGDEPVLMAQRSNVPVVAGPNRNQDIEHLLANNEVDVVISDDGLQHYRLQRDIEIAVIDEARGFGNERCLPAGPLREPSKRLKECDFVVLNELAPAAEYSMQLKVQLMCRLNSNDQQPLSNLEKKTLHAVTGIGNPGRFFKLLKSVGLKVIEHSFPDHYAFAASDISFADELPVVMTEKDAVKCRPFATNQHWYVPVSAVLNEDFSKDLLAKLQVVIAAKSANQNV